MPEPRFKVTRAAAVALTKEDFRRVRDEDAVVVLPEVSDDQIPAQANLHSLFQAAMVAVRATVQVSPGPVGRRVSAVAVLRDPLVYGWPSHLDTKPSECERVADQRVVWAYRREGV